MLIAPPFGLLAHGLAVSKDLSAFADQFILYGLPQNVKNFLEIFPIKIGFSHVFRERIFVRKSQQER